MSTTKKKLSKEVTFILIATPIVLGFGLFVFFSSGGQEEVTNQVPTTDSTSTQTQINNDPLMQKLYDDENPIDEVTGEESREKNMEASDRKYSVIDFEDDPAVESQQVKEQPKPRTGSTSNKQRGTSKKSGTNQTVIIKEREVIREVQSTSNNAPASKPRKNGFVSNYELDDKKLEKEFFDSEVYEKHEIRNGSKVNIRVKEDFFVSNIKIPRNTFLTGIADFRNNRVQVNITSIKLSDRILKTHLVVYDPHDAMEGIYVNGGVNQEIKEDAASEGINQTATRINLPIGGAIQFPTRKLKDNSVILPNGTKLLIREKQQNNNY